VPISSQEIRNQLLFLLDAEGVDHYGDAEDIIPAINASVKWVVSVINSALGQKKLGEEIFDEVHRALVFRTSRDSRVSISDFPSDVWTITAVVPLPVTDLSGGDAPGSLQDNRSYLMTNLYHVRSNNYAKRTTVEKWHQIGRNPFAAGYPRACEDAVDYAYLNPVSYYPDGTVNVRREIEIKPALDKKLVTIFYVEKPDVITALGQNDIALPDSVFNMVLNKALQYISYQQGDQTNLFTVTSGDLQVLVQTVQ
jgi:hypothetical protein